MSIALGCASQISCRRTRAVTRRDSRVPEFSCRPWMMSREDPKKTSHPDSLSLCVHCPPTHQLFGVLRHHLRTLWLCHSNMFQIPQGYGSPSSDHHLLEFSKPSWQADEHNCTQVIIQQEISAVILITANVSPISSTRTNTRSRIVFWVCTSDKQAAIFLS